MRNLYLSFGTLMIAAACAQSSATTPTPTPLLDAAVADAVPSVDAAESDGQRPRVCSALTVTADKLDVAISPPRDHHVSFTHTLADGTYLYVAGGAKDQFASFHADIQRARIRDDGTLEPFSGAGAQPGAMAGSGFAKVGDVIVLAGGVRRGATGTAMIADTYTAKIGSDGVVGGWRKGPALPHVSMHASVVALGQELYVLGGLGHGAQVGDVVHFHLNAEGVLESRAKLPDLTVPRSHQAAWAEGSRLYMSGGLDKDPNLNPPSRDDVVFADVASDGSLGAWSTSGTLVRPLSVHAASQVGCDVLTAGGLTGDRFQSAISLTRVGEDGQIISSQDLSAKLHAARGHIHQLPHFGKFLYAVGGRVNGTFKSTGGIDRITVESAEE